MNLGAQLTIAAALAAAGVAVVLSLVALLSWRPPRTPAPPAAPAPAVPCACGPDIPGCPAHPFCMLLGPVRLFAYPDDDDLRRQLGDGPPAPVIPIRKTNP